MAGLPSLYSTTTASSAFLLNSDGYLAGTLYGNYPDRFRLEGGVVASAQSTPLYGGLPLTNTVVAPSSTGQSSGLGETVAAAVTTGANITSWCVYDQASAGVITATSNAPLFYANSSINFVRVGSGAFVVLPVNPAAVATIAGGTSIQTLYWNFTNNYIDTSGTGALSLQVIALNTNSKTLTYVSGPPITLNWTAGGSIIVVRV